MTGVADRRGTNAEGLLGIFYVLDYGATGDGQHADAGGIQAAIGAAGSAGGGLVAIPPGVYRLDRNVVWGSATNVTIWQHSGVTFTGPGTLPASAGSNNIRVEPSGFTLGGVPTTSAEGDAPAAGGTGVAADAGHLHGREAFGGAAVVQAFGDTAASGIAVTPSRSDHRHGMPGVGSVSVVVLDQSLTTDVWSATNLAAGDNPITGLTNLSFTVDEGTDYLQVIVRSTAFVIPTTGSSFGWDVFVDGVLSKRLGRLFVATGANGAIPGGTAYINGLVAGAHTMSIELWANAAQTGAAYLRAASIPTQEFAQVTVIEVRV